MLQQILEKQLEYTHLYVKSLDLTETEKFINLLFSCSGMIFFTGIGKSGLVAKKIAFTMVSTGTRAFFLSPTDAVHGDLGMVSDKDVFVILSKSGESDELLSLVPAIRKKGAKILSVVSNPTSRLSAMSDHFISLPTAPELCPFDMAPTTSTTIQLMFGDLLTIALMRQKDFSLNEYALNHPSGRIGKRITMKVSDLMLTGSRVPICDPEKKIIDTLEESSRKRCGCILIVEDNKLLGIFMDGDLRRALQKFGGAILDKPIKEMMVSKPRTIGPDVLAWNALKFMELDPNRRITVLPVVKEDEELVGLLHMHDIVQNGI